MTLEHLLCCRVHKHDAVCDRVSPNIMRDHEDDMTEKHYDYISYSILQSILHNTTFNVSIKTWTKNAGGQNKMKMCFLLFLPSAPSLFWQQQKH